MNECVLITGASRRLGRILAKTVAASDRKVVLHYNRSKADAEDLRREIQNLGGQVSLVQADLSEQSAATSLISEAEKAAGQKITGVVNNASIFDYDTPAAFSADVFAQAISVNLAAPVTISAQFFEAADPDNNNIVVNILDQKLWNLNPDFYSYTCSKMGLLAATQMMDMAFGNSVRVAAIAPGLLFPSFDQTEKEHQEVACQNLLRTPIDPNEVARALIYILDSQFRGQVLHIDNGQRFLEADRDVMFSNRPDGNL